MGRWLKQPLKDRAAIEARLDAVEFFLNQSVLRQRWRQALKGLGDLERLTARLALEQAGPREVGAVRFALGRLPVLREMLAIEAPHLVMEGSRDLEDLPDLYELISRALAEDPPTTLQAGGVIREGYDAELDELIQISREGKDWFVRLEEQERRRTGIGSLKVRYNKVFGYYLEVSKANMHLVPPDYHRKQTLVNAERYITADLKEYEAKVLGAEDARLKRESELFQELRRRLAGEAPRLKRVAQALARLDVWAALAETAAQYQYSRPEISEASVLKIIAGRHPVIERVLPAGAFVPNDVTLMEDQRVLIITGPNMSGKSTILRQVALTGAPGPNGVVRAGRAGAGGADRPDFHPGGGGGRYRPGPEHLPGGDARNRPDPAPGHPEKFSHPG